MSKYLQRHSIYRTLWSIGSTLSGYLIEPRRKLEAWSYPCARFSGATILNKKPLGRKNQNFRCFTLPLWKVRHTLNLGMRFLWGERTVTTWVFPITQKSKLKIFSNKTHAWWVCIIGNNTCSCTSRSQVSMVEHLHIKQTCELLLHSFMWWNKINSTFINNLCVLPTLSIDPNTLVDP